MEQKDKAVSSLTKGIDMLFKKNKVNESLKDPFLLARSLDTWEMERLSVQTRFK